MKYYKPLFLFDMTDKKFVNEAEFQTIVDRYPNNSWVLVTSDQKKMVAGFSGNSTRYIDSSGDPMFITKDILVYDSPNASIKIATARDLDGAGETYRQEESKLALDTATQAVKMAFRSLADNIGPSVS